MRATSGPWRADEDLDGHIIWMGTALETPSARLSHHIIKYHHMVEPGDGDGSQFAEAEANAALIAASPTMHEYIERKANEGDQEAQRILEEIDASS